MVTDRKRRAALALGVFSANLLLDRLTKSAAVALLKGKEPVVLLKRLVILSYTENTGAFLSLGAGWNAYIKIVVLLIMPVLVCAAALVYIIRKEKKLFRILTGSCVIGGGMGNLLDRIRNNFHVIDFMNFGIGEIRTGILNVADMSVTFGVIALLIFEIAVTRQTATRQNAASPEEPE